MRIIHLIFVSIVMIICSNAVGQDAISSNKTIIASRFPGGTEAFNNYYEPKIEYPQPLSFGNIEGKVECRVVILEDGKVDSVLITKSTHEYFTTSVKLAFSAPIKWLSKNESQPDTLQLNIAFINEGNESLIQSDFKIVNYGWIIYTMDSTAAITIKTGLNKPIIRTLVYDFNWYFKRGVKALTDGHYKDATYYLGQAKKKKPSDINTLHNLGIAYLKINKLKKACKVWKQAQDLGDKELKDAIKKNCPD